MSDNRMGMKDVADEIFSLIGLKVDANDPVIVATLFQSKIQKQTHDNALEEFRQSIAALMIDVGGDIQLDRVKLETILKAQDNTTRKMVTLARNTIKAEMPKLREEFHEIALEVIREANGIVIKSQTRKLIMAACAFAVIAFGTGIYIGSKYFSTQTEITKFDSSVSSEKNNSPISHMNVRAA